MVLQGYSRVTQVVLQGYSSGTPGAPVRPPSAIPAEGPQVRTGVPSPTPSLQQCRRRGGDGRYRERAGIDADGVWGDCGISGEGEEEREAPRAIREREHAATMPLVIACESEADDAQTHTLLASARKRDARASERAVVRVRARERVSVPKRACMHVCDHVRSKERRERSPTRPRRPEAAVAINRPPQRSLRPKMPREPHAGRPSSRAPCHRRSLARLGRRHGRRPTCRQTRRRSHSAAHRGRASAPLQTSAG